MLPICGASAREIAGRATRTERRLSAQARPGTSRWGGAEFALACRTAFSDGASDLSAEGATHYVLQPRGADGRAFPDIRGSSVREGAGVRRFP